ncbi:hypothetical protein ABID08_006406 [Rhizobium binae]|uniref:Uncharacterized protein n=1 Tax=Rhizobium binae TaxID=1138190 RepID=A0ABV2MRD2_9HYPH
MQYERRSFVNRLAPWPSCQITLITRLDAVES